MIHIGRYTVVGPVSMLRRLLEPLFRDGQIRHYEPGTGVGSWTITSADMHRRRWVPRWLRLLPRGEPRLRAVTLPPRYSE
jgi:hypothetical protein